MAIINFSGWERGDTNEHSGASGGTNSVQGTTKRTGNYALRCNPASSAAGYNGLAALLADGTLSTISRTAETFYTVWFRFEDLPSNTVIFASIGASVSSQTVTLNCGSGGAITITGTTTSSTIATIVADTWYRLDVRVTSNGTSGAKIDGGTEQTVTANNVTQQIFYCGRTITTEAVAFDCYFDDAFISSTAFPSGGQCLQLIPDGDGNYTGWASGTGTTFAEVDDVPHDTDTTYVKALDTGDNTARTFSMTSRATAGVIGAIAALKLVAIIRTESTSLASSVGLRLRSGSTDSDTTAREWTTTYTLNAKLFETDPATSAAWTGTAVDAVEGGVYAGTISQAQRCTAIGIMVWATGVEATGNRRRRVIISGAAA